MERKGRLKDIDRSFDTEYWQRQGSTAIFAAAWQMVELFNESGANYLVTGGYAVMLCAEPRFTKDLDVRVDASLDNAGKVHHSLARFGAPLSGITPQE